MVRVGIGYDVHKLVAGRDLILGGVKVPFGKGLSGHSDADVLLHAICDAVLGAAALGDIGKHFPDSDERYKGIDSKILLKNVIDLAKKHRFQLINVDSIIMAQKPKLAPFIDTMRKNIAEITGLSINAVSVKATTTERLGFVGKEEGMAAQAVVLVKEEKSELRV